LDSLVAFIPTSDSMWHFVIPALVFDLAIAIKAGRPIGHQMNQLDSGWQTANNKSLCSHPVVRLVELA